MPTNPPPVHPQQGQSGWSRVGRGRGGAARPQQPRRQPLPNPGVVPGLLQPPGPVDPMQRLALMMAVMVLGLPQVHSCHASTGSEVLWVGDRMEPKIYPPALARESRGIPAAGEQNRTTVLHKTSSAEQDESATLRVLQQIRLETEKVWKEREEIQKERLEIQRTRQLIKAEMQGIRQLRMGTRKACQLTGEETRSTHQLQAEVHRHLGEVWKPGDDGPILARVGGANLPADGGGTASAN
jgi:hypothetical protein